MNSRTKILLPYRNHHLELDIPTTNLMTIASPRPVNPPADLRTLVRQALQNPINLPTSMVDLFKGGERLLLIIDDLTRLTPIERLLPHILEELQAELKHLKVTILVALGTHRKMTLDEIKQRVGEKIADKYPVINHDYENELALIDCGTTPNGIPIKVNRLIQETDFCFGIGNIKPHTQVGWSGGGKIVLPGICSKETNHRLHLIAARSQASVMGKLDTCLRMEIEHVAHQVGLTGVINTVQDYRGEVIHIVAGESQSAHRRGVELARPIWEFPVPGLADIVISNAHPADIDFWQADRTLYVAQRLVKRGGDIILVAPCIEGFSGQPEHVDTIKALAGFSSRELYHAALRKGLEDYTALTVNMIAAVCRELAWVSIVTDGLSDDEIHMMGFERESSVQLALEVALKRQGPDAKVVVVTHAGEISPFVEEG
jgi:lactate racemase